MKHSFVRPLLITAFLFAASITNSFAHSPWITLQGGHYLTKRPNDGDSFHVSIEGHEYIFRLYFVDAPEISAEFRDRVEEQAKYFGVPVDEVLKVGGWGANEDRMAGRAQQPESEKGVDPFDKFFHPSGEAPLQAAATPKAAPATVSLPSEETTPTAAGLLSQTQLDVNTASQAEL